MNNNLITIGIPFYNDSKFLRLSIESVLQQSYTDWKLILIDDGSTDDSVQIANEYASKDSRIRVVSDGKNKNLANRLNELIDLCDSKYIMRMDADDVMHPDRVKIQLEIMEKDPSIDVLGTNAYSIDENNIIKGVRFKISENIVEVDGFIHPSIISKTTWSKANRYNPLAERMQDAILWQHTKHFSNFKRINLPLIYYREISKSYSKKYINTVKTLYKVYCKEEDQIIRRFWFKKLVITFIKTCIFLVLFRLKLGSFILKRRNLALDQIELSNAKRMLNNIVNENFTNNR